MMHSISILLSAAIVSAAPSVSSVRSFSPNVVTVHAKDFAFTAPKTIKSGTSTWRLVNDGKELHHLSVIRLDKGKTAKDFMAFMKKPNGPPTWMTEVGGPNPAVPGGTAEATITLEPGDYLIVCFIPSPGNPMPHAMKGMIGELKVLPEKSDATAPVADATIRLSDYKFAISKPLTAGHHVLNVVNDAEQPHELVLIEMAPGKTIADFGEWAEKGMMKGPPPGKPVGGMAGLAKGRSGSFPVDLKAGNFGMICFVPDAKDGKSHVLHGMTQQFAVR
jgi:uncharacterized cupredoxin-like copper-binding protein